MTEPARGCREEWDGGEIFTKRTHRNPPEYLAEGGSARVCEETPETGERFTGKA